MQYGLNLPTSNMKSILEQNDRQASGVRTWSQLFGNASLGYQASDDALNTAFSRAAADAYKTNFQQQQNLQSMGLSSGHTRQLQALSRQELNDTYQTYMSNYAQAQGNLNQSYMNEVNTIDTALTERAENFKGMLDSAYGYFSDELAGSYYNVFSDDLNKPLFDTVGEGKDEKSVETGEYEQKITDVKDFLTENGLDWLRTTELDSISGQETERFMSWNELTPLLFDSEGVLTDKGVAFFDAAYNARPDEFYKEDGTHPRTFDEWLSDTNPELRDWVAQEDVFNFTRRGTNMGTLNTITGRESDDDSFHRSEYPWAKDLDLEDLNKFELHENLTKAVRIADDLITKYNDGTLTADDKKSQMWLGLEYNSMLDNMENLSTDMEDNISEMLNFVKENYGTKGQQEINTQVNSLIAELEALMEQTYTGMNIVEESKAAKETYGTDWSALFVFSKGVKQLQENINNLTVKYEEIVSAIDTYNRTARASLENRTPSGF